MDGAIVVVFAPLMILLVVGLGLWLRPWPLFLRSEESDDASEPANQRNVALAFCKWVEVQAHARGLSVRGVARPVPIECPKCHKASNYFVYPDELCERCWRASLKPLAVPAKHNRL
jgi:hypothetical protein